MKNVCIAYYVIQIKLISFFNIKIERSQKCRLNFACVIVPFLAELVSTNPRVRLIWVLQSTFVNVLPESEQSLEIWHKFSWRCSWLKETYKLFVRCVLPILVDETICIRSVSFIQLQNFPRGNQTAPKEMFFTQGENCVAPKMCEEKNTSNLVQIDFSFKGKFRSSIKN